MRACPNTAGFGRRPARTCRTKRTGSNRRGDAGCVLIASINLHLAGERRIKLFAMCAAVSPDFPVEVDGLL